MKESNADKYKRLCLEFDNIQSELEYLWDDMSKEEKQEADPEFYVEWLILEGEEDDV